MLLLNPGGASGKKVDPLVEGMAVHSTILAWRTGAWQVTVYGVTRLKNN